jgi:hypothetical protein
MGAGHLHGPEGGAAAAHRLQVSSAIMSCTSTPVYFFDDKIYCVYSRNSLLYITYKLFIRQQDTCSRVELT